MVAIICSLRLAAVVSVWLHEAAHLIAAALLGSKGVVTYANITGISICIYGLRQHKRNNQTLTEAPVHEAWHSPQLCPDEAGSFCPNADA